MRKRLLGIFSGVLTVCLLAGCGAEPVSVSISSTTGTNSSISASVSATTGTSTETSTETSASVSVEKEPESDPRFTSDKAKSDIAIISDFLAGTGKVKVDSFAEFVDGEQTMEQLLVSHGSLMDYFTDASFLPAEVSSYLADCGEDGEPELFLNVKYVQVGANDMTANQTLIFKPVDGVLNLTSYISDVYRGVSTINKYGFIEESGSSSAADHTYRLSYVDADGKIVQSFNSDTYFGISECTIPSYFLDYSMTEITSETLEYSGNIAVTAYYFGDIFNGLNQYDYDAAYADFVKARKYTFSRNGEGLMPELDYIDKCSKNGVNIVSYKEYEKDIDDYFTARGFSADKRVMDEIDWSPVGFSADLDSVRPIYEAFNRLILGEGKVTVQGDYLIPEGEYTYATLANNISDVIKGWNMASNWSDGQYAYIDCGLDGIPELVLRFFYGDWNTNLDTSQYFVFVRYDNGKLVVFDIMDAGYRSTLTVDKQGGLLYGGANGAGSYYENYDVFDKDHNKNFVYQKYEYYNLGKTEIPDDCLPTGLYQDIQQGDYVWGGDYTLKTYMLEEAPAYTEDISFEEHYGNIARSRYYLFYQGDSNIGPDYDYQVRCEEKGIRIVSYDMVGDLLAKKYADMHISSHLEYSYLWWNYLSMG